MTDHTDSTPTPNPTPTAAETTPKRSRRRTLLISGGAVLAGVALLGGGVAVGAAIADEFDDDGDDGATSSETTRSDDSDASDGGASGAASLTGAASASELLEIIEAASAEAEGEPVGIEAESAGAWDVQFVTAAGDETDVRVDSDGGAAVVGTEGPDQNEQVPEGSLDTATVDALLEAALGHTDGTVIGIEIDDDTASPYDVTVLTADGKTVDIALDADFAVVTADADND